MQMIITNYGIEALGTEAMVDEASRPHAIGYTINPERALLFPSAIAASIWAFINLQATTWRVLAIGVEDNAKNTLSPRQVCSPLWEQPISRLRRTEDAQDRGSNDLREPGVSRE